MAGILNSLADFAFGERKATSSFFEGAFYTIIRSFVRFEGVRELPPGPNDVREIGDAASRATGAEREAILQLYSSRPDSDDMVVLAAGVTVLIQGNARRPDPPLAGRVAFLMGHLSKAVQCSLTQAALMLKKAPEILQLDTSEIARNLVVLKTASPRADISRMVIVCPQLLCLTSEQMGTFRGSIRVLKEALPRINVDKMIQEDPQIAFLDICYALKELTELWGEDEMATIDEDELALALRSISMRPKRTHQYRLVFDPNPLAAAERVSGVEARKSRPEAGL